MVAGSGCGLLKNGAYDLPLPGGPDAGSNPRTITVKFDSVDGLVPKSMVKVGNIAVGEVESIDVDQSTWTAVVTCKIRNDVDLPANAVAQVRRSSLLGEWFVELSPPAGKADAAQLADGATIGLTRTTQSAPVEEVLGALSLLLTNGGVPQLNTIVKELNAAFDGRGPQFRSLLTQLDGFVGQLDDNKGDIVRAIDALAKLSQTLDSNKTQIAKALDELPAGVKVLADQRQQLVTMLSSLDRLSTVATRVVNESSANTVADLRALVPTLSKLAEAGTDIPNALQIMLTFPFTAGTQGAIHGDYVNLDARVDLDGTTLLNVLLRTVGGQGLGAPLASDPSSIIGGKTASGSTDRTPTTPPATSPTPAPGKNGLANLLGLLGLGAKK
ncbi:MCE family protein [Nocardioides marmorisolisilvae]|uniref:MCE family protein n=2 Tax=Nocardioides marmorisolisilvae TaxID=1542737 RepID=A0A3N0DYD7_9ACTN|nr:MCE family protein [Nocardioides marmorisolisilvae]